MQRRRAALVLGLLAAAAAACGCAVDLGPCDAVQARRVYYRSDGIPAYGGQAIVQRSCANGSTCHSHDATGPERWGVPSGLDYDVRPSSGLGREVLRAGVARVREDSHDIWSACDGDTMPPGGAAEASALAISPAFVDLPVMRTPEAQELVRNWLACGAPVVSQSPAGTCDGVAPDGIGDCVAQ